MTIVHKVKIELLTEEAFQPFGQIIGLKDRPPDYRGGGKSQAWWIDFQTTGKSVVSVISVPFQPLTFTKMERHFHVTQSFIPLHGPPAVVALAPPTDPNDRQAIPKPEQIRAFLLDGTKGYVMAKGTWHSLDRFPLYPPESVFVMFSDDETAQDLAQAYAGQGGWKLSQEVDYKTRFGVTFEIVL
jgi:ureidoglycolate hydrolase